MPAFKTPTFQERQSAAAEARDKALNKLRAKPPVDEAELAARTAARIAREAAEAEKRAAAKLARDAEIETKRAAKQAALEAKLAEEASRAAAVPTEAERKAERDARYAARKKRKG